MSMHSLISSSRLLCIFRLLWFPGNADFIKTTAYKSQTEHIVQVF